MIGCVDRWGLGYVVKWGGWVGMYGCMYVGACVPV